MGGTEINYTIGNLGSNFDFKKYKNNIIGANISNNFFQLSNPFRHHQLYHKYHYLQFHKICTDYQKFVRISPKFVKIFDIDILNMRNVMIKLTNILPNSTLTINGIITPSRSVFSENIKSLTLKPNQSTTINIFLCPFSDSHLSDIVFIRTSFGIIPYPIYFHSNLNSNGIFVPDLFYLSSAFSLNLTMRIPNISIKNNSCLVFDSSLFDKKKSLINEKFIKLSPKMHRNGNYLTFVHLISQNSIKNIPLLISVSNKYLIPHRSIILTNPLLQNDDYTEEEIILINPTPIKFVVTSAYLAKDSSPNVNLDLLKPPIICDSYSRNLIGKVNVYGSKTGEIDTMITIKYHSIESFVGYQSLDIPVYGFVQHGSLSPNETQIDHTLQINESFHAIFLKNNFTIPVAILSVITNSDFVTVSNFSPMIIFPGERSKDIILEFSSRYKISQPSVRASLYIETNISNFHIPIRAFDGRVVISEDPILQSTQSVIIKSLGKVLIGSTTNFTFYIRNPNPSTFIFTYFNTSSGIIAKGNWNRNQSLKLINYSSAPFSFEQLNLEVNFNHIIDTTPRNDSIILGSGTSYVKILLTWAPIVGTYIAKHQLQNTLMFGNFYKSPISIESLYPVTMKLHRITSLSDSIKLSTESPFLKSFSSTECGNLSFLVDPNFLKYDFSDYLFDSSYNFSDHKKLWEKIWPNPKLYEIPLVLHFKSNLRYIIDIPIHVDFQFLKDVVIDKGTVALYHQYNFVTKYKNIMNTSVEYRIGKEDRRIVVAKPFEEVEFPLSIYPSNKYLSFFRIPVTTNATPPFFIHIRTHIEEPNLTFINWNNKEIDSLNFKFYNVFPRNSWKQTMFLKNLGALNVSLSPFQITSSIFSVSSNCHNILYSHEACKIEVAVLSRRINQNLVNSLLNIKISDYWEKNCALNLYISDDALIQLKYYRRIGIFILSAISLILPTVDLFGIISKIISLNKDMKQRLSHFSEECNKLSISTKSSTGTQASIKAMEISGGTWVKLHSEAQPQLTNQAAQDLENFLDYIIRT